MQGISNLCLKNIRYNPSWITFFLSGIKYSNSVNHAVHSNASRFVAKQTFKSIKHPLRNRNYQMKLAFTLAGLLKLLGLSEEDEDSELVQIIKKGELALLKKEYPVSEQLFHLALKLAQQLQNENGITFIYDRLANIAFESGQYEKSRKLFLEVMQRLIDNGMDTEDLVLIHISFKLAKIFEFGKNFQNAEMGYHFCIQALQSKLKEDHLEYEHAQELWLMVLTGYAYFHYNLGRWDAALEYFQKAYDVSVRLRGENDEKTIFLLNNLGTVSKRKGDVDAALTYLHKAETLGKSFPDMENFAFIYLNLGYAYLENKVLEQAKLYCSKALLNSTRLQNDETKKESEECLVKVKEALEQQKKP